MRFNLRSVSVLIVALGCLFFAFGGFMLFPVALDLWEHGRTAEPAA